MLDIIATLTAMQSLIQSSGDAECVIGEPKSPPDPTYGRLYSSIVMRRFRVEELTLGNGSGGGSNTLEIHVPALRVYERFTEDEEMGERALYAALKRLKAKLTGDADLGGNVRHIDAAGIYGDQMEDTIGWVEIGGVEFHVAEIEVPVIVDDSQTVTVG